MNRRQRRATRTLSQFRDPGSKPQDFEERLHMIEHNEQAVQILLGKYRATGGIPDVAVLVVDLRDDLGRQLAEVVDPERHAERMAGDSMIPTALLIVPRRSVARGLDITHPRTAVALRTRLPDGSLPVVCIGFGGVTLVGMPLRPMASAATA